MELGEETSGNIERTYVDVLLPLAVNLLTYEVEGQWIEAGSFVAVRVRNKTFTGIVWRVHGQRPSFKTLLIERLLDGAPIPELTMRFWEWLAEYYMAPLGDVMRVALPLTIKPSGFSRDEFESGAYRPRMTNVVRLTATSTEQLNEQFESLKRAAKQHATLIAMVDMLGENLFDGYLPKSLLEDSAAVAALVKKGVVRLDSVEIKDEHIALAIKQMPSLTEHQMVAYEGLKESFKSFDIALLHGITGSGKTEIYIHFIAEALTRGESVLYLLPEIAITIQLIERLRRYFGAKVTLYHSKLSDRERGEIYTRLSRSTGGELVVGVRSAIFLPLNNLGFVVVDEEHENSFKQVDPSPRYNARDAAIYLAALTGAKTLLGSATPSIESYANASSGKYAFAKLTERYGHGEMPKVIISDTLRAAKRGEKHQHFNKILLDGIEKGLSEGTQTILFQNRRGFAPFVECDSCGWTAGCPNCNVTLTYHSGERMLKCHYCGHRTPMLAHCPSCKQGVPMPKGFGTEKIELVLADIFPEARIARLDSDTATSRQRYEKIVSDFENHNTDILIGTQMITKGFDFADVALIGILNADNLLNVPDFRASERAYSLMTQVAGRAGRRGAGAEVIIQTY